MQTDSQNWAPLNLRPIILCIAGSNGAGKTTFYETFLHNSGLTYINPDKLALNLSIESEEATKIANNLRTELIRQKESFIFETVLSDPVGDKIRFLADAQTQGFHVEMIFIAINSAQTSDQRVSMRVSQGGHDVPSEKIIQRFPRTLENLKRAIKILPRVSVFDNSDIAHPYRLVAQYEKGALSTDPDSMPAWQIFFH